MPIHRYDDIVRFADTDAAGICYFARYASFFDESFIDAMRKEGMSFEGRKEEFLMPIVEQKTNFYNPLKAGDLMRTYTGIIEIRDKFFKSNHLITLCKGDTEVKIATGYIGRVTVDSQNFKAISIPNEFLRDLNKYRVEMAEWEKFTSQFQINRDKKIKNIN